MMAARFGRCLVVIAILAFAGCSEPVIRVQEEPAQPKPAVPPIPADQKQYRTLAAMVPVDGGGDGSWWIFKLSGPTAIVSKYEADFDKLFNTLLSQADDKDPIKWDLPAGWTQEKNAAPNAMRFATLKAPGGETEISVVGSRGSVLANAQRWWGQLWGEDKKLDFTVAMQNQYVSQRTVKGRLILRADLYGPKEPPKGGMMMNPHAGGM